MIKDEVASFELRKKGKVSIRSLGGTGMEAYQRNQRVGNYVACRHSVFLLQEEPETPASGAVKLSGGISSMPRPIRLQGTHQNDERIKKTFIWRHERIWHWTSRPETLHEDVVYQIKLESLLHRLDLVVAIGEESGPLKLCALGSSSREYFFSPIPVTDDQCAPSIAHREGDHDRRSHIVRADEKILLCTRIIAIAIKFKFVADSDKVLAGGEIGLRKWRR